MPFRTLATSTLPPLVFLDLHLHHNAVKNLATSSAWQFSLEKYSYQSCLSASAKTTGTYNVLKKLVILGTMESI